MSKRGVLLTMGPVLVALGGCPLLYVYTIASMAPPEMETWDYWMLVLSKMFNLSDAGWVSLFSTIIFSIGIGMMVWGILGFVYPRPRSSET